MMERQEGYYWVKIGGLFQIARFNICEHVTYWYLTGSDTYYDDNDFEHINENRIEAPGEMPD